MMLDGNSLDNHSLRRVAFSSYDSYSFSSGPFLLMFRFATVSRLLVDVQTRHRMLKESVRTKATYISIFIDAGIH